MAKVYETLREKPGFTQFMREEILEKASKEVKEPDGPKPMEALAVGSGRAVGGATFSTKLTGVKYDYASTGDPLWKYWEATEKSSKKARTEREAFLKALDQKMVMKVSIPMQGEVVATIIPPTKTGTESFEMKIPKS